MVDDIKRLVRLVSRTADGLNKLKECWRVHIYNTGIRLLNDDNLAAKKFKAI